MERKRKVTEDGKKGKPRIFFLKCRIYMLFDFVTRVINIFIFVIFMKINLLFNIILITPHFRWGVKQLLLLFSLTLDCEYINLMT